MPARLILARLRFCRVIAVTENSLLALKVLPDLYAHYFL